MCVYFSLPYNLKWGCVVVLHGFFFYGGWGGGGGVVRWVYGELFV